MGEDNEGGQFDGDASNGIFSSTILGIVLLLLSMTCLGTWPALLRLCTSKRPFEDPASVAICCGWTARTGTDRHPCHAYIDYSTTYILTSTLPILWSLHNLFSDAEKETGDEGGKLPLIGTSLVGGALLSSGNMAFQWSTSVFGAPMTTTLAMQASLTVTIGTTVNYFLQKSKTAHPLNLFLGVVAFLIAILLAVLAQTLHTIAQQQDRIITNSDYTNTNRNDGANYLTKTKTARQEYRKGVVEYEHYDNIATGTSTPHFHQDKGTNQDVIVHNISSLREKSKDNILRPFSLYSDDNGAFEDNDLHQNWTEEHQPSLSTTMTENKGNANIAFAVTIVGGICFGFFSPAFNIAVNDPFGWHSGNGLSVAVANMYFSLAFASVSIMGNVYLMKFPPTAGVAQSSVTKYLWGSSWEGRKLALWAGVVCGIGNVLQFHGGYLAGFAAADLVQAYPLVATWWDIRLFHEFKYANKSVIFSLVAMYVAYLAGIVYVASSIAV